MRTRMFSISSSVSPGNRATAWFVHLVFAITVAACSEGTVPGIEGTGGSGGEASQAGGRGGENPGTGGVGGVGPGGSEGGTGGGGSGGGGSGGGGSGGSDPGGTCDDPLDFNRLAGSGLGTQAVLIATYEGGAVTGAGSCTEPGKEVVYLYRPPGKGTLRYSLVTEQDDQILLYPRLTCKSPDTELSCNNHKSGAREYKILDDSAPIYFVINGPESTPNGRFGLNVLFTRFKNLGERCDNGGDECAPGLWCDRYGTKTCVVDMPPALSSALALRGGSSESDLIIDILGTDSNRNANKVWVRALDSNGDPVLAFESRFGSGEFDTDSQVRAFDMYSHSGDDVHGSVVVPAFFDYAPIVTKLEVALQDAGGNQSEASIIEIRLQPAVPEGTACDRVWLTNRCEGMLVCRSDDSADGGLCADLAALRNQACLGAPLIRVGDLFSGTMEGQGLWYPADQCWGNMFAPDPSSDAALRLVLDDMAESLTISTAHQGTVGSGTLISVFPDCGMSGVPLECVGINAFSPGGGGASKLVLANVPAGNYLIVVHGWVGWDVGPFDFKLSVTMP